MKSPSTGLVAGGVIAMTAVVLVLIGTPHDRTPLPRASPEAGAPESSVGSGGFRLTSSTIELPVDDAVFPAGRGSDLVNANCTACHSASMALSQPKLSADQWLAEVTKMRKVYKASIREADVGTVVEYLIGMPGQSGGERGGRAQDPAPNVPTPHP